MGRHFLNRLDLSNQRFGRFVAVSYSHTDVHRNAVWLCICDCGDFRFVPAFALRRGVRISCGCAAAEHGMTGSSTYQCWLNMKQRCLNPNHPSYQHYGLRGIAICERWLISFDNFLADMGEKPQGLTLERKDNNGPYSPDNCKWATQKEQTNNTRVSRLLTIRGETKTMAQWADKHGIKYSTLASRLLNGWTPEKAVLYQSEKEK